MPEQLTADAIQAVTELARATGDPQMVGNSAYAVIPKDAQIVNLEKYLFNEHAAKPERIRQTVNVLDPGSFANYYTRYATADSQVFAYEPSISVMGVLDYHQNAEEPRWSQHRVVLTLRESEEWKIWTAANNKKLTQTEFSEFLEQHAIDISKPDPAAMMEIARDLQGTTEVEFGNGVRMQDGQVGASQVSVPEQFVLSLPVFVGGPRLPLQALLRFRVNQGKLTFWYTLVRAEETKRQAFIASRNQIAEALHVDIINGQPV